MIRHESISLREELLQQRLDLPQQLTWALGLLLLSLVAVMAGLVLIRRAFGKPRRSSTGVPPPPGVGIVERYEIGARLWHFGVSRTASGALDFRRRVLRSRERTGPVPLLGVSWLFVHLACGLLFMLGIVVHAVKAGLVDLRSMLFDRRDWHELMASTRYYLGRPYELPKLGKYASVEQCVFHVALILLALIADCFGNQPEPGHTRVGGD